MSIRFGSSRIVLNFKAIFLLILLSPILFFYTSESFSEVSDCSADCNVGIVTLNLLDDQRLAWDGRNKRPITTHLFYPTKEVHSETLRLGEPEALFRAGAVVWNAEPYDKTARPLIVMSHGTGGSALQMLWFAQALVRHGYIVAGINHHGNTAIEPKKYPQAYELWWERSRDIHVVIDKLLADKNWASHINSNNIGAAGFSLGGYTVISALGGVTDKALLKKFCSSSEKDSTCDPQEEFKDIDEQFNIVKSSPQVMRSMARQGDSYKVEVIKTAFVIAPAVVRAFTQKSLQAIRVPLAIVVGGSDQVAPAITNAKYIHKLVNHSIYTKIPSVGHYTFLSQCTQRGKQLLKSLCQDQFKVDRVKVHTMVANQALNFFDTTLKTRP